MSRTTFIIASAFVTASPFHMAKKEEQKPEKVEKLPYRPNIRREDCLPIPISGGKSSLPISWISLERQILSENCYHKWTLKTNAVPKINKSLN